MTHCLAIESEVELKDIDAWFTKQTQLALARLPGHQVSQGGSTEVTLLCHPAHLVQGSGRGDVRVEAGRGGGYEIDGNGVPFDSAVARCRNAVLQRFAGGAVGWSRKMRTRRSRCPRRTAGCESSRGR